MERNDDNEQRSSGCVVQEEDDDCREALKLELTAFDVVSCFISEVLGTGILIFLGCMGCVKTEAWPNNHLQMVINFGLVVMIILQSFSIVSGSHINPSVTIVACVLKMVSIPLALIYLVAQCLGAFLGYGLLKVLMTEDAMKPKGAAHGLCVTFVHKKITTLQGFGIEFFITAILALVCCGVWDPRNAKHHDSVSLRFGFAITALACTAGPFTGGSMNPARSLGPALWNWDFTDQWIYWVAPSAGAFVTTWLYRAIFHGHGKNEKRRRAEEQP